MEEAYLRNIRSNQDASYIYVTDLNAAPCVTAKKAAVRVGMRQVEDDRVMVVVPEIEGWYLAGLDSEHSARLGVNEPGATDQITKERFEQLRPRGFDSNREFMLELLDGFSVAAARQRTHRSTISAGSSCPRRHNDTARWPGVVICPFCCPVRIAASAACTSFGLVARSRSAHPRTRPTTPGSGIAMPPRTSPASSKSGGTIRWAAASGSWAQRNTLTNEVLETALSPEPPVTDAGRGWLLCRGAIHRVHVVVSALIRTQTRHSRESGNLAAGRGAPRSQRCSAMSEGQRPSRRSA